MTLHVNDAGTWKEPTELHVNDAGTWKPVLELWVKDGATWKLVRSGGLSFDQAPGTYEETEFGYVEWYVTASETVTWTYTKASIIVASMPSGSTGTTIGFNLSTSFSRRSGIVNLTALKDGVTYNWTITLVADA